MQIKYRFTVFGIFLLAALGSSQLLSNKYWPISKNVATSRASPIDINTFTATPVFVTPLVRKKVRNERGRIVNTGNSVEVHSIQGSRAFLTGGVLYNETYIYHSSRFFWSDNNTNIVDQSINGVGTTLAAEIYYFNKRYSNFNNSLNHYDGLAILSFFIGVGFTPNPTFNTFQRHLQKVCLAGSQLNIEAGSSFIWYDNLRTGRNYYAYPGSYTNIDNNRIFNCATVIVFPFWTASSFISWEQFVWSFGQLKNTAGKPLTHIATQYPVAGRPVVNAFGILETEILLDVSKQYN